MKQGVFGVFVLMSVFAVSGATMTAANMTLMGKIGDAKCGVKHMMADEAKCTEACVKEGSDYALIVGDKAYTLKTTDATIKADIGKLAGKEAEIVGDVNGTIVTVTSVKMGMMKK